MKRIAPEQYTNYTKENPEVPNAAKKVASSPGSKTLTHTYTANGGKYTFNPDLSEWSEIDFYEVAESDCRTTPDDQHWLISLPVGDRCPEFVKLSTGRTCSCFICEEVVGHYIGRDPNNLDVEKHSFAPMWITPDKKIICTDCKDIALGW